MKRVKKFLLTGLIVFVHTGWIIPIYLGFSFLFTWFYYDVIPVVWKSTRVGTSFPLVYTKHLLMIGFFWMALLAAFWSIQLARRLFFKKKQSPAAN